MIMEQLNSMNQLNSIDRECLKYLSDKFYVNIGKDFGKSNGYEQTILRPRLDELEMKVKDTYPEYFPLFFKMKNAYLDNFKAMYSEEKKSANKEAENQLDA